MAHHHPTVNNPQQTSSTSISTPVPPSSSAVTICSPRPRPSAQYLSNTVSRDGTSSPSSSISRAESQAGDEVPPCLLSPAFTPPSTPGNVTPNLGPQKGIVDERSEISNPKLLRELPEVECIVRARIPTTNGSEIFLHLYHNNNDNKEHLAIVFGNGIRSKSLDVYRPGETEMDRMIRGAYTGRLFPGRISSSDPTPETSSIDVAATTPQLRKLPAVASLSPSPVASPRKDVPLVRIHSECYTGETAWSARCDCGEQLDEAARLMSLEGNGVIVYLRQEGRGIGLLEKLKAYNLQDLGNDTVTANLLLRHPADARTYGLATAILMDLEQTDIRLLTNNPDKIAAVEGPNKEIRVAERVPMIPLAWKGLKGGVTGKEVGEYLKTKITRMGHMLDQPAEISK